MSENIVHLVLARLPDAPPGVKGISLFIVPKYLVNDDGSLGARNDVHCLSIEKKLGIKSSPTAVLQYGQDGGAVGYLLGDGCFLSVSRCKSLYLVTKPPRMNIWGVLFLPGAADD